MSSLDFSNEPTDRPKELQVHQEKPYNAEPYNLAELINHNITPLELVYGRNHGPIPDIKEDDYKLTVNGLVTKELNLTLLQLKRMPKVEIVAALQVRIQSGKLLTLVRGKSTGVNVQDS